MAYSGKKLTVIVNGVYLTGFRDGDAYKYEEGADRFTRYEGVDGKVDYSERAGNPCSLLAGLKNTSPSNAYLDGLYQNRTELNVTIVDFNDGGKTISASDAVIMKRPDESKGKEIGEMEWTFDCPDHSVTYK